MSTRVLIYLFGFTMLCYLSILCSPVMFWPASFLSQLIPLLLVIQFGVLILLVLQRKKIAALPLLALLLGWPFLQSTFLFNSKRKNNYSIQVLSFNAKFFRQPRTYSKFSTEMIQWVANDTAAIKCLQEYSTNPKWAPLDATGQIEKKGYQGYTFQADVVDRITIRVWPSSVSFPCLIPELSSKLRERPMLPSLLILTIEWKNNPGL
jgi:hypothetical protein